MRKGIYEAASKSIARKKIGVFSRVDARSLKARTSRIIEFKERLSEGNRVELFVGSEEDWGFERKKSKGQKIEEEEGRIGGGTGIPAVGGS